MAILGEVFSIIRNGASIKQIDGANGFPITRIETISNRVIDRNRLGYANVFDITEYESYVLQSGDILMSHINSEKHLGKTALYIKKGNEKIIHGMNLLMLRANSEVILPLYAKYFFDSNLFLKQIPNITKKSVNQASFTVTALKKLEIKIPQMVEQKRIIDIMSRLDNIIQYRKDQLEKLDLFVKSRFIEMSKQWGNDTTEGPLEDYLSEITYGFTNPMPDTDEGPWKITAKDVTNEGINFQTARKTKKEDFDLLTAKSKPIMDDILVTKDGSLGRIALVNQDNICINQSVALLRCNQKVLPKFLASLLKMDDYQNKMLADAGGVTIKHIYITRLAKMVAEIPSLENQSKWLEFLQQVNKSKLAIQQSLDELETLKKSLMQQYFG